MFGIRLNILMFESVCVLVDVGLTLVLTGDEEYCCSIKESGVCCF